jgi:hypothetical protein
LSEKSILQIECVEFRLDERGNLISTQGKEIRVGEILEEQIAIYTKLGVPVP